MWAGLALATSRAVALPGAAPQDPISPEILSLLRANQELLARTTDFASRALQDPDALDAVAGYDALAKDSLDLAQAAAGCISLGLEPDFFEKEKKIPTVFDAPGRSAGGVSGARRTGLPGGKA
jgi:hypothetical protein